MKKLVNAMLLTGLMSGSVLAEELQFDGDQPAIPFVLFAPRHGQASTSAVKITPPQQAVKSIPREKSAVSASFEAQGLSIVYGSEEEDFAPILMSESDYYREFNTYEERLSQTGRTLRSGEVTGSDSQVYDKAQIQKQVKEGNEFYSTPESEEEKSKRLVLNAELEGLTKNSYEGIERLPVKGKEAVYLDATSKECSEITPGALPGGTKNCASSAKSMGEFRLG